ncbi:MAG TPA: PSD1 and planctomycete cytochrome C domain-containing protein, partial [Planctomycetota bacterium]|nr:PSD1 and planctomycete cytochrome C domain-containing protein [Planctomycetota bacterium]
MVRRITFLALLLASPVRWALRAQEDAGRVDFYAEVRPVLTVHCYRCHGHEVQKGGLRLDVKSAALRGGESGEAAIVPGRSSKSPLYLRVVSRDRDERMPSKGEALPAAQAELLRRWIDQGADWPDSVSHWAFQPLRKPEVPSVEGADTPVDAFILRELRKRGLDPSPEADRRTLLRRVTFDLTGLPPTPEEVDAFVKEGDYPGVVERLLASPAYGERWGRHWLDFARYAESTGYEANSLRPAAWRYRDYVVRSFNDDTPYDRFLRQQLAGDELEPLTDENLVATGFLAAGRLDNNQEDRAVQRNDHLIDLTNATASVAFGLQFGCAQCHDHKWDPITQADYYRFQGFFVRGQVGNLLIRDPEAWAAYEKSIPPELEPARALKRALLDGARRKLLAQEAGTKSPDDQAAAKALGDEDKKLLAELDRKIQSIEKSMPDKPHAWGYVSPATSPSDIKTLPIKGMYPMPYDAQKLKETHPRILKRGDPHQPGPEVTPGWPAVLGPTPEGTASRTALVDWLTAPGNPLLARVFVNFVWARHFGRGIVETPGDFGLRGARPTHPELLDWLAAEFVAKGWSVKDLHRGIVRSAAYRRSAAPVATSARMDPENRLLWRWSPRRLEAEAIRDAILAASGELDRSMGGPGTADEGKATRRTIYLLQKRHGLPEVEELFDAPSAGESC